MTNTDGVGITRLQRMKTALDQILTDAQNINVGLMRFHGEGGPVLYPIADIDADANEIEDVAEEAGTGSVSSRISNSEDDAEEVSGSVTLDSTMLELVDVVTGGGTISAGSGTVLSFEKRVSNGKDDAEERVSDGDMDRGSSDLELSEEGGSTNQIIGVRFRGINIPAGSYILSAEIEFEIDRKENDVTNLVIEGELKNNANPQEFGSSDYNISNRNRTAASVTWSDLPVKDVNEKLITPDLKTITQEVIDQANWSSGKPMVFFISGTGQREVESYNGEASAAPLLRITYSDEAPVEAPVIEEEISQQTVGLRFQNILIPQGATITNATIEFEAENTINDSASLTIKGENHDDAPTFTSTDTNLSTRAKTTASVGWNNLSAWTAGSRYQTPDIKTVIQEIVDRPGWCGANSLAIFINGVGGRSVKSFEGAGTGEAVLNIEYDESSVAENACTNETLIRQVSSGNDDAEERINGSMYLGSSDLELVYEGGSSANNQKVGIRFRNINIPANSTIIDAYVEFTAKATNSGTTNLTIKGEKNADAASFSSVNEDITNRPKTTASVSWSPSAWSTIGDTEVTSNITSIIQEIVNQSTWSAGNALALFFTGSGEREAHSFNGSASNAARLIVTIQGALDSGASSGTVRQTLKQIVSEIEYKSGTPLVDTMYEAALYYRGDPMKYGNTRGNSVNSGASLSRSEYTRLSHPASYTGGTIVRSGNCTESNPNSSDCRTEHINGNATYISPIAHSCQANHIILLSDGYPSRNTSKSFIRTLTGVSDCAGSGSGECGVELVDYIHTNDQKTGEGFEDDQLITTHTIGFNILESGKEYLEDMAASGGGGYHPAASSADLVNAFESILGEVISRPTSFAAPSLSVNAFNPLYHNNEVYLSLFLPTRDQYWQGNLKKYKICKGEVGDSCERGELIDANDTPAVGTDKLIKDTAESIWGSVIDGNEITLGGAASQTPLYSARNLYTYTAASSPNNVSLVSGANLIVDDNSALTKSLLGDSSMTDTDRTKLINWIRGQDVKDEDEDNEVDEDRWSFSDLLHGSASTISYGYKHTVVDGEIVPTLDNDGNLIQVTKLLIPGNDGSLRMINSSSGVEEWAFIPKELLLIQKTLMNNIEGDHVYGLDNTVSYRYHDINHNGIIEPTDGDYVHAYVSMRRGGRNIYALNITPASTITSESTTNSISPRLLWQITGGSGSFSKLGQTWSRPVLASVSVLSSGVTSQRNVLIFAGGYHPDQDDGFGVAAYGNAIYIVDAATGTRLWWASAEGSGADLSHADMEYAIPSDLLALDTKNSGSIDRIYVGDTGGQLWRIDLGVIDLGGSTNNSALSKLASVSDRSTDAPELENQRKFFYPPTIVQISDSVFSDIENYDLLAINTGNRAHPLDETVHDRIYAFRDTRITSSDTAISTIVDNSVKEVGAEDDLYDATANVIQEGDSDAQSTAIASLKSKKGWYIDLLDIDGSWNGEKGLAKPVIVDGKLFFTTYVPGLAPEDPCGPAVEGGGYIYGVEMLTGGARFEWDDNGQDGVADEDSDSSDRRLQLGPGIPSGPAVIVQEEGADILACSGGGCTKVDPDIGLPKKRTFWIQTGLE